MNKLSPHPSVVSKAPSAADVLRGRKHLSILQHLIAALFGGYLFTWGVTTLGVTVLVALGVAFHEAETSLLLLAFLILLAVFLWAFSTSLLRAVTVLGGGAVFMTAVALGLQQFLLS